MQKRTPTYLALALLLAASLGVSAFTAWAQSTSRGKSTAAISRTASRRKRSPKKLSRWERGQKAPSPDRISEIQQALTKDGSFSGTPNGKWDTSTVEAMKKFQDAHGLNPSGKLDAKTLQQLGLGSQTAGVAAPMPPTSSTTGTVKPTQTARSRQ